MTYQNQFPSVEVVTHPLAQHNLTIMRKKESNHDAFVNAFRRYGSVLLMEAFKILPLEQQSIETPLTSCEMPVLTGTPPCLLVPILRAGLGLSELASAMIPEAAVFHIGMYRDEETHRPVWYYDKTPSEIDSQLPVFVLDPMLATGHSALAALDLMVEKGVPVENITFVCMISAPEGLQTVLAKYPNLRIVTGAIDSRLNEDAYIVPGLGDAGDRLFNSFL